MIGLYWEKGWTSPKILIGLFLLFVIGVASKAAFSSHKPERISWRDRDFRMGFIVPNVCAFSTLVVVILINIYMGEVAK